MECREGGRKRKEREGDEVERGREIEWRGGGEEGRDLNCNDITRFNHKHTFIKQFVQTKIIPARRTRGSCLCSILLCPGHP